MWDEQNGGGEVSLGSAAVSRSLNWEYGGSSFGRTRREGNRVMVLCNAPFSVSGTWSRSDPSSVGRRGGCRAWHNEWWSCAWFQGPIDEEIGKEREDIGRIDRYSMNE